MMNHRYNYYDDQRRRFTTSKFHLWCQRMKQHDLKAFKPILIRKKYPDTVRALIHNKYSEV